MWSQLFGKIPTVTPPPVLLTRVKCGPTAQGGHFPRMWPHMPHRWMKFSRHLSLNCVFSTFPFRFLRRHFCRYNIPRNAFLNLEKKFPGVRRGPNREGGGRRAGPNSPRGSGGQQPGGGGRYPTPKKILGSVAKLKRGKMLGGEN